MIHYNNHSPSLYPIFIICSMYVFSVIIYFFWIIYDLRNRNKIRRFCLKRTREKMNEESNENHIINIDKVIDENLNNNVKMKNLYPIVDDIDNNISKDSQESFCHHPCYYYDEDYTNIDKITNHPNLDINDYNDNDYYINVDNDLKSDIDNIIIENINKNPNDNIEINNILNKNRHNNNDCIYPNPDDFIYYNTNIPENIHTEINDMHPYNSSYNKYQHVHGIWYPNIKDCAGYVNPLIPRDDKAIYPIRYFKNNKPLNLHHIK